MKEIIFRVEIDAGCGYRARAVDQDIFTQGRTIEEIKAMVLEAVECHFSKNTMPKRIRTKLPELELVPA
jgi:Zn ribbon nucleic-acid-binding protein